MMAGRSVNWVATTLAGCAYGLLGLLLWLPAVAPVQASAEGDGQHILWSVEGKSNRMYLLGSVHLLAPEEPLPAAMLDAYKAADAVVMEMDLSTLDPAEMQAMTMELAMLPAGTRLQDVIAEDTYAALAARLTDHGMNPAMMEGYRPWMVALTLTQLLFAELGLDPEHGVETRLTAKALEDGKPLSGLETLRDQLQVFAGLPESEEHDFLRHAIDEYDAAKDEVEELLRAWRTGDVDALTALLLEGYEDFPALYEALAVERHKAWLPQLEAMLEDGDDVLVVVGAMHLVGPDSVVDMLEQAGYEVERL